MEHSEHTPNTNDLKSDHQDALHSALVHTKDISGFKIPEGKPDPRGWSVKSADGTTLGKVEDLLFDTGEARIRYIEVKTDGDISRHGGRDYFLLPIGSARLDDENDDVVVDMAAAELTGAPAYERGKMSREYETSLRDYVREQPGAPRTAKGLADREVGFYGSPEYDDASFFQRRHNANIDELGASGGVGDRATSTGMGDRITEKMDDLIDRVDGNPASRPGPDSTDRRI